MLHNFVQNLYAPPDAPATPPGFTLPDFAVFTPAHDSRLLREPWVTASGVSTRACVCGDACKGRSPMLPGHAQSPGGITLTETLTPAEFEALDTRGVLPAARRVCILCMRYHTTLQYTLARRRGTPKPTALVNAYANPVGDGGYAPDKVVPQAELSPNTWLGVLGHVAALDWKSLRLVQDPTTRRWFVDQTLMFHVPRSLFPVPCRPATLPPPRIQFDPREVLRCFFKFRTAVADRDLLFEDAEALHARGAHVPILAPDECLLNGSSQSWCNFPVGSFHQNLLVYRINRLSQLAEVADFWGRDIAYALILYRDAHAPLVLRAQEGDTIPDFALVYPPHEESLPDVSRHVLSAALGVPGTHEKTKLHENTMERLFALVLPEMAHTKALNLFLSKAPTRVVELVRSLLVCSLLGNYRHAQHRVPFSTRLAVLRDLNSSTGVAETGRLLSSAPQDSLLVLYVVREYVSVVSGSHAMLSEVLGRLIAWEKQALKVLDMMRVVRAAAAVDWRQVTQTPTLELLAKHYKRLPKKTISAPQSDARIKDVNLRLARELTKRGLKRDHGAAFAPSEFMELTASPENRRARSEKFSSAVEAWCELRQPKNKNSKDETLVDLPDSELCALTDFVTAASVVENSRVVPLPEPFLHAQLAAVSRRMGIAQTESLDAAPLTTTSDGILRRVCDVLVCPCCMTVKNFALTAAERTEKKKTNTRASGWRKMVLDDGVPRCAQRPPCRFYSVLVHNILRFEAEKLVGGILVCRAGSFVISPCCGHVCHVAAITARSDGTWDCPACFKPAAPDPGNPDATKCAHCSCELRGANAGNVMNLLDNTKTIRKYSFCKKHYRTWARSTTNGHCSFEFVTHNMTNFKGKGLILPS